MNDTSGTNTHIPTTTMNSHFQQLSNQLAEWQSLQPLKREDSDRLWRKLRLDWNYHSNHIEGNTLTYGETEILLIHGQATGDHGLRDYMEMKAHDVAIDHMRHLVDDDRPLTEADIRDFNRILLKESFWKDAITPDGQSSRIEILPGEYKKQPNNVRTASGEIFRFADPAEVPIRMNELVQWLRAALDRKELHPVEIASKLHHDFVLIHPFGDGNGRTARLLVNYVLMRNGFLPLIVPTEQKDRYLAALRRADTGELRALTDYLAKCAESSMNLGIKAAKGESIEEPDDLLKEIELFKRRQKGENENVVRKTDEVIRHLYDTNLQPLFCELVETLGQLNGLFDNATYQIVVPDHGLPGRAPFSATLQTEGKSMTLAKTIQFSYYLKGFKGAASHPFEVESQIVVSFSDYHYVIGIGDKTGETRSYGQPMLESERKAIARAALEQAFAQIKRLSGIS